MTLMDLPRARRGDGAFPGAPALALLGGLYWLLFVLVLEPDNALRAFKMGHPLSVGHEAVRIAAAAVIGAAATPIPLALTLRYPLVGDRWRRNLLVHIAGAAALAFVLVLVGCIAAAWGFERRALPSLPDIRDELAANWTLLVFAVFGFTAVVQLMRRDRSPGPAPLRSEAIDQSAHIFVGMGARLKRLDPSEIDWIESQGNYLALHAGPKVHLIRRTLKTLETMLDGARFVRIHRGAIVAIDRIREMKPLTNGDAVVTLADGRELRVSRNHREALRRRWLDV